MRKIKIIATIGPSIENYELLKEILKNVDGIRFNLSHSNYKWHEEKLKVVREIENELNKIVTTIADTKGGAIRTNNENTIEIKANDKINLIDDLKINLDKTEIEFKIGDRVYIDDGKIEAEIIDENLNVIIKNGGIITKRRKISFPDSKVKINSDYKEDLEFIQKNDFDIISLSFVKNFQEILEVKKIVGEDFRIIAKIETKESIENINEIVRVSDGIMIARGDLALNFDFEKVPILQKEILKVSKYYNKLTIVATQLLDSMINNPFPTRAEINDVANCVFDGVDSLLLTNETSVGKYPLNSIKVLNKIIIENQNYSRNYSLEESDPKNKIANKAREIAEELNLPIVSPTIQGTTPSKLSSVVKNINIYAISPNLKTLKFLNLFRNVYCKKMEFEPILENYKKIKKELNLEDAVFVFGYPVGNKNTNVISILWMNFYF